MASASRSMKFEVQVQIVHPTAIENVAADYFNCQEALKWLLTRLRNTAIEELRFFDVVFMEPAMRLLREMAPTISLVKNLTVRPPFGTSMFHGSIDVDAFLKPFQRIKAIDVRYNSRDDVDNEFVRVAVSKGVTKLFLALNHEVDDEGILDFCFPSTGSNELRVLTMYPRKTPSRDFFHKLVQKCRESPLANPLYLAVEGDDQMELVDISGHTKNLVTTTSAGMSFFNFDDGAVPFQIFYSDDMLKLRRGVRLECDAERFTIRHLDEWVKRNCELP